MDPRYAKWKKDHQMRQQNASPERPKCPFCHREFGNNEKYLTHAKEGHLDEVPTRYKSNEDSKKWFLERLHGCSPTIKDDIKQGIGKRRTNRRGFSANTTEVQDSEVQDSEMLDISNKQTSPTPDVPGAGQQPRKRKQEDNFQEQVRQAPKQNQSRTSNPDPRNAASNRRKTTRPPQVATWSGTASTASTLGNVPRTPGSTVPSNPDLSNSALLRQPPSRPISPEQLAAEVKNIYSGLIMVETKCIHVVRAQAHEWETAGGRDPPELEDDHWQALIALHRTLLHEHHDFFLASQHPSASPALRRLAAKYSMPARMWKHGIHSFLELLRYRLPDSLEYMLAFIYLAYQIMALLYETVPSFKETWIECLGDLARYRMAVEDEDLRDREIWAAVARGWYTMANNLIPNVGRLYHHLAILSRHNPVQQLHFYCRSLIAVQPFLSTRDSVLTLMDPILNGTSTTVASPEDKAYIKTHAMLLKRVQLDSVEESKAEFLRLLEVHLNGKTDWIARGTHMAMSCIAAIFEYGSEGSALRRLYDIRARDRLEAQKGSSGSATVTSMEHGVQSLKIQQPDESSRPAFSAALRFNRDTFSVVAQHKTRPDVMAFIHIQLVFILSLVKVLEESADVSNVYDASTYFSAVPWQELVDLLNYASCTQSGSERSRASYTHLDFLSTIPADSTIPDDAFLRGQVITKEVYPESIDAAILQVPEEERLAEKGTTAKARLERVLYFGIQIARALPQYLQYDKESALWSVPQPETVQHGSKKLGSKPFVSSLTSSPQVVNP